MLRCCMTLQSFAIFGGVYAFASCIVQRIRQKKDGKPSPMDLTDPLRTEREGAHAIMCVISCLVRQPGTRREDTCAIMCFPRQVACVLEAKPMILHAVHARDGDASACLIGLLVCSFKTARALTGGACKT